MQLKNTNKCYVKLFNLSKIYFIIETDCSYSKNSKSQYNLGQNILKLRQILNLLIILPPSPQDNVVSSCLMCSDVAFAPGQHCSGGRGLKILTKWGKIERYMISLTSSNIYVQDCRPTVGLHCPRPQAWLLFVSLTLSSPGSTRARGYQIRNCSLIIHLGRFKSNAIFTLRNIQYIQFLKYLELYLWRFEFWKLGPMYKCRLLIVRSYLSYLKIYN